VSNVCRSVDIPDCVFALDSRATISTKGSIVVVPKVEIKWRPSEARSADGYDLIQDTFIHFTNDFPRDVEIQAYFINGDEPLDAVFVGDPQQLIERAHDGWNWVDCQFKLTNDQSSYWRASTGQPIGCQPFWILDRGSPPGRPDLDGWPGDRVLRGYVIAWAVDRWGEEISWNHLHASATIVSYSDHSAWEYNAYSFQNVSVPLGEPSDGNPGQLLLDGVEYDKPFERLVFDFHTEGSRAFSPVQRFFGLISWSDLTLLPVNADLRQDGVGPVTTKAKFDIWNEDEVRFSGTDRCITCWDQTLLKNYDVPNHFLIESLHTARAKARVKGMASTNCPFSVDSPLLGVIMRKLSFVELTRGSDQTALEFATARSAVTLRGQGLSDAVILNDIIARPQEAQIDEAGYESATISRPFRSGKLRRNNK
jgi:hypothetical protein